MMVVGAFLGLAAAFKMHGFFYVLGAAVALNRNFPIKIKTVLFFGVAITLAFIVILDANSLRRQVGKHAREINKLNKLTKESPFLLRERMGHTHDEILAGILIGLLVGCLVFSLG